MISSNQQTNEKPLLVGLVGQPNCGKTTLFNALTGLRQQVGNYPGVTVEKKLGKFYTTHGKAVSILDLPGVYSLTPQSEDERVTQEALTGDLPAQEYPDLLFLVLDASNLERHLSFALEVLDLGIPTLIALNKVDVAEGKGLRLDVQILAESLGVPVIPCQATSRKGVIELKQALALNAPAPQAFPSPCAPPAKIKGLWGELTKCLDQAKHEHPSARAMQLISDPTYRRRCHWLHGAERDQLLATLEAEEQEQGALGLLWSKHRQDRAHEIFSAVVTDTSDPQRIELTDRLDRWLLHPFWGFVCFGILMLLIFYALFEGASPLMDGVEEGFSWLGGLVENAMPESELRNLIVHGAIGGVGGVVVFLPQILLLFLFIGLLESSGYMARAAFLMDGPMRRVGLSGKSFIPLLSSYACAIPGIMGTRTIDNAKDRLVTLLIAPWMSCSARLPVYTLLIAVVTGPASSAWLKAGMLISVYALGTLTAFATAWFFRKTIAKGERSQFLLELPMYRMPDFRFIGRQLWDRGLAFLRKAGTLILSFSILLWFFQSYPKANTEEMQLSESYLGQAGKVFEPVVKPLGYDWRIGVSVLCSFAAREVFTSSVAILFTGNEEVEEETLRSAVEAAVWPDGRKLFDLPTCFSLLVFYVFALQCLPTVAMTKRETNSWKWAAFQFSYMTGFAYLAALLTYQLSRFIV